MRPQTSRNLRAFAAACNWTIPHPLDRRRFHKFVATAFKENDLAIPVEEFERLVREYSTATPRDLDAWYRQYEAGIALLKVERGG